MSLVRRGLALAVVVSMAAVIVAGCGSAAGPAAKGDVAAGQTAFTSKGCSACHGANGEGGIGPKIAGTSRSLDQVTSRVRSGGGAMPAFDSSKVSDQDIANIYAFLQSKK